MFVTNIVAQFLIIFSSITIPKSFAQQHTIKNIPGNGTPSFHLGGPGQEYNGPDEGVERSVTGICEGRRLTLHWNERPRDKPGTPRLLWIKEITLDEKLLDTSKLVKFEKLFIPFNTDGFNLGCRWSKTDDYRFIVHFQASVYYEFSEYWACTLGGPRPKLSRFTWYFYVSEEKGVFNPYVWPTGRLGDNIQSVRGVALEDIKPEDFPDCAAYEETGFPLTLE